MIEVISAVMGGIFLIAILSYYVLLFIPERKPDYHDFFHSITVVIPARNEEQYIARAIASVKKARFDGKKQIIVVNDASIDRTGAIISKIKGVETITNKRHSGKSASLNKALQRADGELFAVVDGDSTIEPDALTELARELSRKNHAAAAAVIRCENRMKFWNVWVHIELIYSSLIRSIFTKVHANVTTPGALSMYRTGVLREVGGFSTQGFSEDMDIALRMVRKGYHVGFSDTSISNTNMPTDVKGFLRQRTRMARGMVDILRRHLKLNRTVVDLYTMPLFLFSYLQAIIMGSIITYQIVNGYWIYYAAKGVYFSWDVLRFFFDWFTIVGTVKWMYTIVTTQAWTVNNIVGAASTLLTYPLYALAILRYDHKVDLWHIIPFFMMFPFWFMLMVIYVFCVPEIFYKEQYNIWKKNE